MTACQQACATGSIVFGDINNPKSQVAQNKKNPRNYLLLGELNNKPRTSISQRYVIRILSLPHRPRRRVKDTWQLTSILIQLRAYPDSLW